MIFDYDGLIVDTELAEYVSWKELYQQHGVELALEDWLCAVGYVHRFDPRAHLENFVGHKLHWEDLDRSRGARNEELAFVLPVLPGVRRIITEARISGFKVGVASNSTAAWVEPGLERLGLRKLVDTVRTRDTSAQPKPAPDVYLNAIADLGATREGSYAFEDSEPGIAAAKAAGLFVVAVPNALTSHQDLTAADLHLSSLECFSLPLG